MHSAQHEVDSYKEGVATTFADVIRAKYLLLTTFTKDGRPKPTAIWGCPRATSSW